MPLRIAALILAVFCVGTAELSPSGMLDQLSADLSVSIARAGLLVTFYALTMVVGGPFITSLTGRIRRRTLLVSLLSVFIIGNIISTLAPSFGVLLVGRMVTAVIHGTFLAVCVVIASDMVSREKSGTAVAATQLGINFATILGVPFGSFVAQHYSWRATFGSIAVLAAVAVVVILSVIPDTGTTTGAPASRELRVFRNWNVLGTVFATVLCSGGMFTLITYMVPLLTRVGGFPDSWIPALLVGYGVGSIVGILIGGKITNWSADVAVISLSWTLAAVCALYWVAAPSAVGGAAFLILFSLVTFALIPGLQTRVLSAAADAPALSLTANMSAFGLGAALGSWAGGQIIDRGFGTRSVTLGAALITVLGSIAATQTVYTARRPSRSDRDGDAIPRASGEPVTASSPNP
jgi:DHA1 family inner membrane transport protein